MTKNIFKNAIAWLQWELNNQRRRKNLHELEEYVCNLPGVKELKDEIYTDKRTQMIEMMVDMHAEMIGEIDAESMNKLVWCAARLPASRHVGCLPCDSSASRRRHCLCCGDGVDDESHQLLYMQALYERRATHQVWLLLAGHVFVCCADRSGSPRSQAGPRHDGMRAEALSHQFTRWAPRVGATGMPVLGWVANGGKTNVNGNLQYYGVLPSLVPQFCTIFAKCAAPRSSPVRCGAVR